MKKTKYIIERQYILSIETAVAGGSLSLFNGRNRIDGWTGRQAISRAEDVLAAIAELLKKNRINKHQIELIVASKDAGSLTGEKIGLAIAKGLAKSVGSRLVEASVLESLLDEAGEPSDGEFLTAIRVGKNRICRQAFRMENQIISQIGSASLISEAEEFVELLKTVKYDKVILAADFIELSALSDQFTDKQKIIISSKSLAEINAQQKVRLIM